MTSRKLEYAIKYRRMGWFPIPLCWPNQDGSCGCPRNHKDPKAIGKAPLHNEWETLRLSEEEIRKIWTKYPEANVGILLEASNLFVVDLDGQEAVEEAEQYGLPDSPVVKRKDGHKHLYYSNPGIKTRAIKRGASKSIDILTGGQVVAPPSTHREGHEYRWEVWPDAFDPQRGAELSRPAPWMGKMAEPRGSGKIQQIHLDRIEEADLRKENLPLALQEKILLGMEADSAKIYESRSELIFGVISALVGRGWPDEKIAGILLNPEYKVGERVRERKNAVRYIESEIARARAKGAKPKSNPHLYPVDGSAARESETQPDPDPELIELPEERKVDKFPVTVFPGPIRQMIEEAGRALGVEPDFAAIHTLTFLGMAIGNSREIELKPGYRQRPILYTALIGEAGSGKSPALEMAFSPLKKMQRKYYQTYKDELKQYQKELNDYETQMKAWKKQGGEKPKEPKEPRMKDIYTTHATKEALLQILKHNRRGVVIKADELSGWISSMNQYKGGKGDDRETFLSLWNGDDIKVNRVKMNIEDNPLIPNPFCGVTGGLQPDLLPRLEAEEGAEDGFIHRILFSFPDRQDPPEWTWDGLNPEVMEAYQTVFDVLFQLQPEETDGDMLTPKVLKLSWRAKEMWADWHYHNAAEMKGKDFNPRLRGPWAKMPNQLARLALILQLARAACGEAEETEVDEVSLHNAIRLVGYFKNHAAKVYEKLTTDREDRRVIEAIEWIKQRGGIVTRRDIYRYGVAGCKNKKQADALFEELADRGYGKPEMVKPSPKGGRPSAGFRLNGF